jgi:hypothetical protein
LIITKLVALVPKAVTVKKPIPRVPSAMAYWISYLWSRPDADKRLHPSAFFQAALNEKELVGLPSSDGEISRRQPDTESQDIKFRSTKTVKYLRYKLLTLMTDLHTHTHTKIHKIIMLIS